MRRILNRYIIREVVAGTALVLLILFGLQLFIGLVSELSSIGRGDYTIWRAMQHVVLMMPFNLYQFFPMAGLLGTLLGLGRLVSSNQLMVMRASGYSINQVAVSVAQAAVLMLVMMTALGEWLGPYTVQQAALLKSNAIHRYTDPMKLHDVWLHQDNEFIHINTVLSDVELKQVDVYQFGPDHRLVHLQHAAKALKEEGVWRLHQVKNYMNDKLAIRMVRDEGAALTIDVKPKYLRYQKRDMSQLSVHALFVSARYRDRLGLSYQSLAYHFWQRVLQPLTTIVMLCLGVPFVFGSLRNVTMAQRMVFGVLVGFGFYILNQLLGLLSIVFDFSPFVAAFFPTVVFAVICFYLLKRVR